LSKNLPIAAKSSKTGPARPRNHAISAPALPQNAGAVKPGPSRRPIPELVENDAALPRKGGSIMLRNTLPLPFGIPRNHRVDHAPIPLEPALDRSPMNSPAKMPLERGLGLMRKGIDEMRRVIQELGQDLRHGLQSSRVEENDLVQALKTIPGELDAEERFDFRFLVTGRARRLDPAVRDEVYRIGYEAMFNACRHSGARRIEMELEFSTRRLRLIVRDNGRGINLKGGPGNLEGRPGLLGMSARAQHLGAKLEIWTRPAAGTEIALFVPAFTAFKPEREN
jgi:hypothetical protein